jgi:hypothetical protein
MYEAKAANKNCVRVSAGPLQNPKVEKTDSPGFQLGETEDQNSASQSQNSG